MPEALDRLKQLAKQTNFETIPLKTDEGEFLSGGTISDIFDIFQTSQFAMAGLATGKGLREGIRKRTSYGELLNPEFRNTLKGRATELAFNIVGDPLTYLPVGGILSAGVKTAAKNLPRVARALELASGPLAKGLERTGLKLTQKQKILEGITDEMFIAEAKGFDASRDLAESIRKGALLMAGGNKKRAEIIDKAVGRFFDVGADEVIRADRTFGNRLLTDRNLLNSSRISALKAQQNYLSTLSPRMRSFISLASQRIVQAENSILEGLERTGQLSSEIASKWRGFHLRAVYDKFENPAEFVEFLEKSNPIEALKISNQIETLKTFGKSVKGLPTGVSKKRKLLFGERGALGEIAPASARVLMGQTLGSQAVARGEALAKIASEFSISESNALASSLRIGKEGPEGFKIIKDYVLVPDSAKWGALRGKILPKEVGDIIIQSVKKPDALEKLTSWFKFSKVVLNPSTRARNMRTNLSLAINNIGLKALSPNLWRRAIKEVVANGPMFRLAKSFDSSFVDTFSRSELNLAFNALKVTQSKTQGSIDKILETMVRGLRFAGRTYQMEEQVGKMLVFLGKVDQGFRPKEAALMAGKALFNYRKVPPFIEFARRKGIYPFVTFPYKVATEAIPSALERPGRFAGQVKAIRAFTEDLTSQEERALPLELRTGALVKPRKELVAKMPWLKDAKGNAIAFDLTYELFFGDLGESGTPVAQVKNMFEGRIPFRRSVIPFLTPVGQSLAELAIGQNVLGIKITRPGEKDIPSSLRHIVKTILPSAGFEASEAILQKTGLLEKAGLFPSGRLATAMEGKTRSFGRIPLSREAALAGTFAGIKTIGIDPSINAKQRRMELYFELKNIVSKIASVQSDPSIREDRKRKIIEAYQTNIKNLRKQFEELGAVAR